MSFIDVESLQKLSYERCKIWSDMMENMSVHETLEQIDINELENTYGPECDENDSNDELASMEEDCDTTLDRKVLRNIINTKRLSSYINKPLPIRDITRSEEQNELIDIVNKTLPIISENNRQLREYGLDKILSTFDKKEIEEKVGSWLNRHNSLYGGDNTVLCAVATKNYDEMDKRLKPCARYLYGKSKDNEMGDDTDDSLQSGETARYIRSSKTFPIRKTTSTIIKTYRKAKSTREALCEKYACELNDDEHRHCKRTSNIEHCKNRFDVQNFYKTHKYEITLSSKKQRRKVLRKRTYSNSCSTMDSSSDSDYSYRDCRKSNGKYLRTCRHFYSAASCKSSLLPYTEYSDVQTKKSLRFPMKMPSARNDRIYYYLNSKKKLLSTSSSSSNSSSSVIEKRLKIKRNANYLHDDDSRPCKLESACDCCNSRKLCEKFKHIADTSTEEWFVENCSPKKIRKPRSNKIKLGNSLIAANKKVPSSTEIVDEGLRTKSKSKLKTGGKVIKTREKVIKESKSKSNTDVLKKEYQNKNLSDTSSTYNTNRVKPVASAKDSKYGKPKNTTSLKPKSVLNDETESESEIYELKMAIEASKKSYEEDQRLLQNKKPVSNDAAKVMAELQPVKKAVSRKKKQVSQSAENAHKTRKIKKLSTDSVEFIEKLPKVHDDSTPCNSVTMTMSEVGNLNTINENSFANAQAIYNSTALCTKSTAYKRQIADQFIEEEEEEDEDTVKEHAVTVIKVSSPNNTVIDLKSVKEKQTKTKIEDKNSKIKISAMKNPKSLATKKIETQKQTVAASSTVTSTTSQSPEENCGLTSKRYDINDNEPIDLLASDDQSDCDLVTSSTNIDLTINNTQTENTARRNNNSIVNTNNLPENSILIYAPHNQNMTQTSNITNDGYLTITKEHLSGIIGENSAEKFIKYYVGRKRFNSNSTIYYIPPNDKRNSSMSDSADDLDYLGASGNLYVINN